MTRNALITGVGRRRGIGAGIAAGLALDGWDLALSFWSPYDDRLGMEWQPDDPDLLADELRSLGRRIELVPADLEDRRRRMPWCTAPASSWARSTRS